MTTLDWDIVTNYSDVVTTTLKTVTFPKVQEQVYLRNQGNANLTYTIGSQSGSLTPGQSVTVTQDISSFTLQAVSGTHTFELRAKEKGTEINETGTDVMSLLADIAKNKVASKDAISLSSAFSRISGDTLSVMIPQGTYEITSPINFTTKKFKKIRIYSETAGTTIVCNNSDGLLCSDVWSDTMVEELIIENLTIINKVGDKTHVGLTLGDVHKLVMKNVSFSGFDKGLLLYSCYTVSLDRVFAFNCNYGLYTDKLPGYSSYGAVNVLDMQHSFMTGCSTAAIRTNIGSSNTFRKCDFTGNNIDIQCDNTPIKAIIDDCYFEQATTSHIKINASANFKGIVSIIDSYFGDSTGLAYDLSYIDKLTVRGNTYRLDSTVPKISGKIQNCVGEFKNNSVFDKSVNTTISSDNILQTILNSPKFSLETLIDSLQTNLLPSRDITTWSNTGTTGVTTTAKTITVNGVSIPAYAVMATSVTFSNYKDVSITTAGYYTFTALILSKNNNKVRINLRTSADFTNAVEFNEYIGIEPRLIRLTRYFNAGDTARMGMYWADQNNAATQYNCVIVPISLVQNFVGDTERRFMYETF
jgi:hypothetical protein